LRRHQREEGDEDARKYQQRHSGRGGDGSPQKGVKNAIGLVVVGRRGRLPRLIARQCGILVGMGQIVYPAQGAAAEQAERRKHEDGEATAHDTL